MPRVRFLVSKRYPHPNGPKRRAGAEVIMDMELAELWHARGIVQICDPPAVAPNEAWTVAKLRAYATERGISLGTASRKADILRVLLD